MLCIEDGRIALQLKAADESAGEHLGRQAVQNLRETREAGSGTSQDLS
jgi:hypothetical protein